MAPHPASPRPRDVSPAPTGGASLLARRLPALLVTLVLLGLVVTWLVLTRQQAVTIAADTAAEAAAAVASSSQPTDDLDQVVSATARDRGDRWVVVGTTGTIDGEQALQVTVRFDRLLVAESRCATHTVDGWQAGTCTGFTAG